MRVYREGADTAAVARLGAFLADIDGRAGLPTPRILSVDPAGRFAVEKRLPGISLLRRLAKLKGEPRRTAISRFVAAAGGIAKATFDDRPYGHILAAGPIHADTWTGFFRVALDRAIAGNAEAIAGEIGDVDRLRGRALDLIPRIPERPAKGLVHGDYFPGNVLMDDSLAVSAVVDFSGYTLVGDPAYDTLTAPIFLEMIDGTTPDDWALARHVARTRVSGDASGAAAFYRAYAAFLMADPAYALPPYPRLYPWAIDNLRRLAKGSLE